MKNKDICDIIIEKTTKEWYNMINSNTQTWITPQYSGNKIEKSGKILSNDMSSQAEISFALDILNNWRASHAYPLQIITDELKIQNPNAIVAQRLKRLDSITGKLQRNPTMNLYKMQDIGGCRVIVASIDEVYKSLVAYKQSAQYILKKENDYIQNPKESGYRSYHIVYQYYDEFTTAYNKNILIEIQFRTKLQHIWATAVEVMSIYTKSQLKASLGHKSILRFFILVSSLFAQIEHTPVCPNTIDDKHLLIIELKEIDRQFNIISRLNAISKAIQYISSEKIIGKGYYLLQLNFHKRLLKINGFTIDQIGLATDIYNKIEHLNDFNKDVVLVSATSFEELQTAYPNYFTDISNFTSMLQNLLQ